MTDLRFALRVLLKQPGFTLVAVATLGLGIGANTALFSVVNGVLLRSLPVPEAERVVVFTAGPSGDVSAPTYLAWRERNRVLEEVAAVHPEDLSLTGFDEPERVRAWVVSPSFFRVVQVDARWGRTFLAAEGDSALGRTVVLSHGFWQRRFGTDPDMIGRNLTLDGESFAVVGVMPPEFRLEGSRFGSPPPDLYVRAERGVPAPPIDLGDDYTTVRDMQYLVVIGRLQAGVSLEQAEQDMNILANALAEEHPDEPEPREVLLASLPDQLVGSTGSALWVLLGAVGFVLLIACVNVANLLLARATGRQREMAVRATLGASRWRVIRQLLSESLLLAFLGAVVGVILAVWSRDLIVGLSPRSLPRIDEVGIDWTVLGFALVVTLATGVVFGLLPALHSSRPDLVSALKEGARTSGGLRGTRTRSLLVTSQISLALVLLIGAGLMVRSFQLLERVDPGFRSENLLTMRLWLPDAKYDEDPEVASFFRQLIEQVESIPGVVSASTSLYAPLDGGRAWMKFRIQGRPESTPDEMPVAGIRVVGPSYFRTVGVPLIAGRDIHERDDAYSPPVALINETMRRRFWPQDNPLGKRISGDAQQWIEIVGVVGDIRDESLASEPEPMLFVPHQQMPLRFMTLVLRARVDPMHLVDTVRGRVRTLDPDLPVYRIRTADEYVDQSLAGPRFQMVLIGAFALMALSLAVVGIYGLMAYGVSQRAHEVGIRMALGARRRDVIKLIWRPGVGMTFAGVGIGVLLSLALTRVLASLLYGVSSTDPRIFLAGAVLLAIVALTAAYVPARRAARVDPLIAIRHD